MVGIQMWCKVQEEASGIPGEPAMLAQMAHRLKQPVSTPAQPSLPRSVKPVTNCQVVVECGFKLGSRGHFGRLAWSAILITRPALLAFFNPLQEACSGAHVSV